MSGILKRLARRHFPGLLAAVHELRSEMEMRRHAMMPTPYGFRLKGHGAMRDGRFEPEETALIQGYLPGVDVFVDVGANVGFFACLARTAGRKVVAVEPLAQNLRYLYANLEANSWTDVEVYPVGLASRPGIAPFYGGGTGASLLKNWAGTSEVWRRPVPLTTLDILLGGRFAGETLFIKIDVEGTEYEVLLGAKATLARSPAPAWLVEVCLDENRADGINPHFDDVFRLFRSYGYSARTADAGRRVVAPEDVSRWIDRRKRDFGGVTYLFERP